MIKGHYKPSPFRGASKGVSEPEELASNLRNALLNLRQYTTALQTILFQLTTIESKAVLSPAEERELNSALRGLEEALDRLEKFWLRTQSFERLVKYG